MVLDKRDRKPLSWDLPAEGQGRCAACKLMARFRYRLLGAPICIACLEGLIMRLDGLLEENHPWREESAL